MLWVGWSALQRTERGKIWSSKNLTRKSKFGKTTRYVHITENGNGKFDAGSAYGFDASNQERHPELDENFCDEAWYVVLQVGEDASVEEITKAYKKLISQYHPDKVATLGHELRVLAERKSKKINSAYDFALGLKKPL